MSTDDLNTLQNIINAGKQEFLDKGFQAASLRNIVKNAGVTTGAFYGYYKTKEELFDAIVGKHAAQFMRCFKELQDGFHAQSPETQLKEMMVEGTDMHRMVDCIYEDTAAFVLIIYKSKGTRYENFIHEIMDIEMAATHQFIAMARSMGVTPKAIDPQLEHILLSGYFSALFELVAHDTPRQKAYLYTKNLMDFYTAGWKKIMGL